MPEIFEYRLKEAKNLTATLEWIWSHSFRVIVYITECLLETSKNLARYVTQTFQTYRVDLKAFLILLVL